MLLKPCDVSRPMLLAEQDPNVDYLSSIQDYSKQRLVSISKSVIYKLQRIPAQGIFEGDTGRPLKTAWDEWCWFQENYDNYCGVLSWAFEETLSSMISGEVVKLKQEEAVLISCAVCEDQAHMPARDDDAIFSVIREVVTESAGRRSLVRFELF